MGLAIAQDEKFACVAFSELDIILAGVSDPAELGHGCWTSSRLPFQLDPWWRQQLGNVVSEQLEQRCSFVLLAKQQAVSDGPFDEATQVLRQRVLFLMWGIAVAAGVPTFSFARLIFGRGDQTGQPKLSIGQFAPFRETPGANRPRANMLAMQSAVTFLRRVEEIAARRAQDASAYQRVASGIDALVAGFQSPNPHARLHQFVRAVEAFLPASVFGRSQFADYAATFLTDGDQNHTRTMLREMYDLRSAAEHHRRFDQRALPDVTDTEVVAMRRTRQAETLARELHRRFLAREESELSIFRDEESLEDFWEDRAQVVAIWGEPLNLNDTQ